MWPPVAILLKWPSVTLFWTGVWNNDNSNDSPVWLVTRPLDATYALDSGTQEADPFVSDYGAGKPLVKLVGADTAKPENPGTGQDEYDIYVPKELCAGHARPVSNFIERAIHGATVA